MESNLQVKTAVQQSFFFLQDAKLIAEKDFV